MANMAYCRFQNTLNDLRDCLEHITDSLGEDEDKARDKLIKLCEDITADFGDLDAICG